MYAFQTTEEDVLLVIRRAAGRLAAPGQRPLSAIAAEAFSEVDADLVEAAALDSGTDLEAQTAAALREIERQLVESLQVLLPAA